jgi:hypothetical protein
MVRVYVYSSLQLTTVLFANLSLVPLCGSFCVFSVYNERNAEQQSKL